MRYNVKKKNTIRSKMKPRVNENEMSTNADVMDMTMLILLLYNYYYISTLHPTIIIRHK